MGVIKDPKFRKYILLGVIVIVLLFLGSRVLFKGSSAKKPTSTPSTAKATQTLNKDFSFPVTNVDGKQINMKFTVQDASLDSQIVVQGQNATAISGRIFLIITLKLTNDFDQSIKINTRDYVRLSINGDENTWLAPEIHNDPVEVQAISTKFTRLGFTVNTTDKKLVLQIGEIKGDKQKINLNL